MSSLVGLHFSASSMNSPKAGWSKVGGRVVESPEGRLQGMGVVSPICAWWNLRGSPAFEGASGFRWRQKCWRNCANCAGGSIRSVYEDGGNEVRGADEPG